MYNAVADQLTRNFFDQQRALSPNQQTQIFDDIQQSVQRFPFPNSGDETLVQRQKERSLHGFPKLNSDLTPPKPDFGSIFPISSNSILSNYPTLTPPPPPPKSTQKTSNLRDQFRDSSYVSPFLKQPDNQNYVPLPAQDQQNIRDYNKYAIKPEGSQNYNPYPTTNNNFQKNNNFPQQGNAFNTNYGSNTGGSHFHSNGQSFQNNIPINSSPGPINQNSHTGNIVYGSTSAHPQHNNQFPTSVGTTNYQNNFNNQNQNIPLSSSNNNNNYQQLHQSNNYQTFGNVYPSPNINTFQTAQTTPNTFIPPVRDTFSADDAVKTISSQYFSSKHPSKIQSIPEFSPSPSSVKPFESTFDSSLLKYQTQQSNTKTSLGHIELSASTPKGYENYELRGNEISTTSSPKVVTYFQKPTQGQKTQPTKNSKIEIIKDSDVELDTTLLEKQIRQQLLSLNDQGESFPPNSFTFNPGNLSALSSLTFDDGNTISVPSEDKVEGSKQIKTIVIRQPTTTTTTTTTTTIKPPSKFLEEVTKNIPSGARYEILKTTQDGTNLEIEKSLLPSNLPNQKKVTFVILEEQPDGSVKVQDVKSNNEQSGQNSPDVDSILKKIKDGELKLPQSNPSNKPKYQPSSSTSYQTSTKPTVKPTYVEYKTYSSPKPTYATPPPSFTQSSSSPAFDFSTKSKSHFIPTPIESPSPEDLKTLYNDVTKDYYNDFVLSTKDEVQDQPPSFFVPTPNKKNNNEPDNYESNFVPTTASAGESNYYGSSKNKYFQYSTPSISSSNPTDGTSASINENKLPFDEADLPYKGPSSPYYSQSTTYTTPRSTTYRTPSISTTLLTRPTASFTPFLPTVPSPDVFSDHTESPHTPATRIRLINTSPNTLNFDDSEDTIKSTRSNTYGSNWFKKTPSPKSSASSPVNRYSKYPDENEDFDGQSSHHTVSSDEDVAGAYSTTPTSSNQQESLNNVLKKNGLFAMAKFLRQSGLDQILNETGPYTIFVPTDKAFKALLVQLGGPDKAEEKFKENPRLLSGLLLHHVIPGAFKLDSLQDEMTGVSLAGTQLRVNTYTVQDIEWNDVQVLTVNGAKIVDDKKDIAIPQGIAHAVDRVMFPLPVGDLLQTLQSDRDGRFNHFLKVLQYSGLVSLFTGIKTYTVFAPINKGLPESQMSDLLGDSLVAKKFILKHIVPGALYSAGMRYYQVKESMDVGQKLKVYKEAGRVKVNSAQVITRNIPATNGVVHAIEVPL
ncbi:hypothetical protein M8J75_002391 [Diaphorina citri]|nr:hypothetical protein M8J75_002391 [Diaphorina citri]